MRYLKAVSIAALLAGLAAPAVAGPEDIETLRQQCAVQLNFPANVCDCIAQTAAADLNDNQQAFTAAQVTSNGPEIARTQSLLNGEENLEVMTFMTGFGGCNG